MFGNRINACADAVLLLKSIGLPGIIEGEDPSLYKASALLPLAELNKIPLLYLESIRKDSSLETCHGSIEHEEVYLTRIALSRIASPLAKGPSQHKRQ